MKACPHCGRLRRKPHDTSTQQVPARARRGGFRARATRRPPDCPLNADHHGDSPARHSRRIVDNAGEAIISADETSRIVLANPAAASMFGLTAAQMLGPPGALHPRAGQWRP
ncbi:PAS domain-containing protein [Massilia sp. Dwa41.01b]|uniref:PAS domain-containing protein n=1 Tax=Massilia sp. Dwa41.01b TaxID=2709302 RepID=UPI001E320DCA|nr:PAS domain-containing protein [Massilia sp. Dwa41.01b]